MTSAFGYVNVNGKILLVKHNYGAKNWHLPGGEVKKGESPKKAALRELEEETGFKGEVTNYLGNIFTSGYGTAHIYNIKIVGGAIKKKPDKEVANTDFFTYDLLPKHMSRYAKERIDICRNKNADSYYVGISKYSNSFSWSDTKKVLLNYMNKAISEMDENIIDEAKRNKGDRYVHNYFTNLKNDLLKEIIHYKHQDRTKNPKSNDYFGIDNRNIKKLRIYGKNYKVFSIKSVKPPNNKPLINIILPCKNSSETIVKSIKFLVQEMKKSQRLFFNVTIFVNNTDDTMDKILVNFPDTRPSQNYNVIIIESPKKCVATNSDSINICKNYLNLLMERDKINLKNSYFSTWDDELDNRIKLKTSIFQSNLNILIASENNKAISCYMVDSRRAVSRWHSIHNSTFLGLKRLQQRCIVHNGGGIIIRWEDISHKEISGKTMPGTDISALLLLSVPFKTLKTLGINNWPLRINKNAPIFHPVESDILQWTAKYLKYFMSWEISMDKIKDGDKRIANLWTKRINENKRMIHNKIDKLTRRESIKRRLDKEFMHAYYKVIKEINEKETVYPVFKNFRRN